MTSYTEARAVRGLRHAVHVLCPIIEQRVKVGGNRLTTEYDLRKELVGCILGSRVRNESALAWTDQLVLSGLLDDVWWGSKNDHGFQSEAFQVLAGLRRDLPNRGAYRFALSRSRQLNQARMALAESPLAERLCETSDPLVLRRNLVGAIHGIGPKQASMFLRNSGTSFGLAILDTHVMNYLRRAELLSGPHHIQSLTGYEKTELRVIAYADLLGVQVGYLDWAIWATMRAARELNW